MDELQATIDANAKPDEPRITQEIVNQAIKSCHYFTAMDGVYGSSNDDDEAPEVLERVTICAMVLQNNFVIIGKSAPVSAANFDEEIGRQVARRDAENQVWPLLGFNLLTDLKREEDDHNAETTRAHG